MSEKWIFPFTLAEAVQALYVTQPALTHAIRKLEDQLETRIWAKDGRKIRLTQSGVLLELAGRVLPQMKYTEFLIKQILAGKRGLLRIGMECHPYYKWLQYVLTPFLKNWPYVEVELKQQFQFSGVKALMRYEVDILITPDPYKSSSLEYVPVFDYKQVLAVSKEHKLAGLRGAVGLAD